MTALTRVSAGPAQSSQINQLVDAWNGNTGGVNGGNAPLALTAINDPLNYALAIRNSDAAGKGLIIYAPDGTTPLLRVDKTGGVSASPDGIVGAAPVVTTTSTQTLTGKTLGSPTITGTLGVGGSPQTTTGIWSGPTLNGTAALYGISNTPTFSGALSAGADTYISQPIVAANASIPSLTGFHAANPSKGAGTTLTTVYGLIVDAMTAGVTNNYGVYINAPSGGATNNFGLFNIGAAQVNGATTALAFFGHAANSLGTVTGSRGANAALGALLTVLASYGLITDSSTA